MDQNYKWKVLNVNKIVEHINDKTGKLKENKIRCQKLK